MDILFQTPNTKLWNMLFTTKPSVVKEVTSKAFACSSAHPYWITSRMTEVFGACGQGWGIEVKDQGFERIDDENTHHWALVELWYIQGDKRCASQQMGGTKAKYKTKNGSSYDEDAPKKSVTDAFVKCASMLGLAGDIHSGLWHVNGYQDYANNYWQNLENQQNNESQQNNQYANAEWVDTESKHAQIEQNNDQGTTIEQNQSNNQGNLQGQGIQIDKVLFEIANAHSREIVSSIYNKFKKTPQFKVIEQACADKIHKEGWGKKQNQEQMA